MTKPIGLALFIVLSVIILAAAISRKSPHSNKLIPQESIVEIDAPKPLSGLLSKAREASDFAKMKGFNERFCFLIDMRIASARPRFFVYDLQGDSVLTSGLVTHGRCNEEWLEGRRYSNVVGGGCTSLGKYRVGAAYTGRFGAAFKLHGLEASNKNAFERFVVLHGHECVPASETGSEICQSDGCPTLAPAFLKVISPMIRKSSQPVLLWIFE